MPFSLQRNDITRVDADTYVLAANSELLLGGGVAGAIARAAGREELQAACDRLGGCPVGSAVVTPGFGAKAKWIIHAVGPVWQADRPDEVLRAELKSAYEAAFACAAAVGADSVAVPLLSAGTFGCPEEVSLALAYEAAQESPAADDLDIILVLYGESARNVARARFAEVAEYIDDAYVRAHPGRRRYEESSQAYGYSGPGERGGADVPLPDWLFSSGAPRRGGMPAMAMPTRDASMPDTWMGGGAKSADEAAAPDEGVLKKLFNKKEHKKRGKRRAAEPAEPTGDAAYSVPLEAPHALEVDEGADACEAEASSTGAPYELEASYTDACEPEMPAAAYSMPAQSFRAMPMGEPDLVYGAAPSMAPEPAFGAAPSEGLEDFLNRLDEPFSTTLLALIDARGLTDAQVYKRANLSRQHFAKIRSDAAYRPTKKTVLALAVALELTLPETRDLLARAGFALSNASKADLIVRYYIERGNYNIFDINEALYAFDQPLLA